MRKTLLAPIIKKEKRGVFQWLTMMMILRSKARALNLKRTKKSLMKWVVSAVGKRAHRSLIRSHFTPFLNEYKKCCYKRAWDITWGKRLREGWVAWNKEVIIIIIIFNIILIVIIGFPYERTCCKVHITK